MDARSHSSSPAIPRSAEYVIAIDAPPDAVWKAITDARELERWFPLTASVTPGVGGALTLRWGEVGMDHLPISIWKPGQHLQIGMPQPSGAAHVVHDFMIEDHGTSAVLRLVAHGFDPDVKWDEFYSGVRRGWRYELESLRHYLTHHRGRNRDVGWVRTPVERDDAGREWATLRRDDAYSIATPDGRVLTGTVVISEPPRDFTGTVKEMNNGLLRLQIESESTGLVLGTWLATWGVSATCLTSFKFS